MLSDMPKDLKDIIISTQMPKFIWVSEISDKNLLKEQKTKGIVLLDATEANNTDLRSLIFAWCNGYWLRYVNQLKTLYSDQVLTTPFTMFNGNLK